MNPTWRDPRKRLMGASLVVAALCLLAVQTTPRPALSQQSTVAPPESVVSLLKDDFEQTFANDDAACPDGGCEVAKGWGVWYVGRRDTDAPGVNVRPRYGAINNPRRVKSGVTSQRVYVDGGTFTGGMYRVITNVRPGTRLRFSAMGMSWSTNDDSPISARPSRDVRLRIGIDPAGGDAGRPDPSSASVIWSQDQDGRDEFDRFTVEAEARGTTVVIYTFATMRDVVKHNEVFWDDALLDAVTTIPPTAAPTVPANATATTAPSATIAPSATPKVGRRYVVRDGDTLFGIALRFETSVDELRRLNRLTGDTLSIGQELIIDLPSGAPVPVTSPTIAPTRLISGTPQSTVGILCLYSFFDSNGNGLRDLSRDNLEDLVPNITFNVKTGNGAETVRTYISDGINEPFCISNMPIGNYRVEALLPGIYLATTPLNNVVNVPPAAEASFAVGLRRLRDANRLPTTVPTTSRVGELVPGLLAAAGMLVGAAVLVGAGVLAFNLLLRRKRI